MADFVLTRTGTQVDDVVEAGNNAGATGSDTLLHSANIGNVLFDAPAPVTGVAGIVLNTSGVTSTQIDMMQDDVGGRNQITFGNPNGLVGFINSSGTTTAYNVSSDPELKNFKETPTDEMINNKFNDLFDSFRVFNWKSDPSGDLVWGFDAWVAVDNKCGIGTDRTGPRELALGEVYNTIPAVIEPQEQQVVYKTGDKKGELRFNADNSPMMETIDVVVTPQIEEKVTPAGVDQGKATPILLAKIEQQGRYMTALQIGLNDALNRLTAAGL